MKKVFSIFLAAAAMAVMAVSCTKDPIPLSYDGDTVIEFPALGGTKVVTVKGETEIKVVADKKFAKVSNDKNDITIEVGTNPDESPRNATVTVSNGVDTPIEFQIKQQGAQFEFNPEKEYSLPLAGGSIEIAYSTNLDFSISTDASWLKIEKKTDKVVLSAPESTTANEAVVSYSAGNNAGEFTVKQFDPVQATLEVFLQENAAKSQYKYNAVFFTVKGTGITEAACVLAQSKYVESEGIEYYHTLITTSENASNYAMSATALAKVNSEAGYTGVFSGLKGSTPYTIVIYVSNGSSKDFLVKEITTEANPDPLQGDFTEDDVHPMSESPVGKTWDLYSNGQSSKGAFGKRQKLGTVSFTKGGESSMAEGADSLVTSGFNAAIFGNNYKENMAHHLSPANIGGYGLVMECVYDYAPSATTGQFYIWATRAAYSDYGYYVYPMYPLYAMETEEGYLAYLDFGFGEYNGYGELEYIQSCRLTFSGDYEADPSTWKSAGSASVYILYDMLLVPQSVPTSVPSVSCTSRRTNDFVNYYSNWKKSQHNVAHIYDDAVLDMHVREHFKALKHIGE